MSKKTKAFTGMILLGLLIVTGYADDSRNNPVTATYCDGSTVDIYPYSFVTHGDGTTFSCYEVQTSSIQGGLRYAFEDFNDADYNDLIIDLWVTDNESAQPVVHVRYVSKDAEFLHWLHIVYNGTDILVFKAEEASPGDIFDIPLPAIVCPDFEISAEPASLTIIQEGSASLTVTVTAKGGFSEDVSLTVGGLPEGATANFTPNPVTPTGEAELEISVSESTPANTYTLTIRGEAGELIHSTEVTLIVEEKPFEGTITKTFNREKARPGDELQMNIRISNQTDSEFENIEVTDVLSSHLVYLDDDSGVQLRWKGQKAIWEFSRIRKKETIKFRVRFIISKAAPPGKIENRAFLDHSTLKEPLESNLAVVEVEGLNPTIEKSTDRISVKPDGEINYQLKVKNASVIPLTELTVTDELSSYLEFISQEGTMAFTQNGNVLQWKGKLEADTKTTISFKTRVKTNVIAGTRIANRASLEAKELEEKIFSNTVYTTLISEPAILSDIRFAKKAEVPQAEVGRIVRFRFVVENRSPSALIFLQVEDALPQGFRYVSGTSTLNGALISDPKGNSRIVWNIPDIKPYQTSSLRFQVIIGADARRGRNINRGFFRAADSSGQEINLEASEFINVSSLGFIFYSGVEGYVYLDRDEDEFFSMADTPLEGIEVLMSTGEKDYTDAMGHFRFENLFPGEYAVGINQAKLPEKYSVSSYPVPVVLSDGLTAYVDFAVNFQKEDNIKNARLSGRAFFDKNQNQAYDPGDLLLKEFQAKLDGKLLTNGSEGKFVFSHIEPGSHTIEILYEGRTLKKEIPINLNKGNNQLDIPLRFSGVKIIIKEKR